MIEYIKLFENIVKKGNTCLKEILRIKNGFNIYNHNKPEYTDIKYNIRININNKEIIGEVLNFIKIIILLDKMNILII